MPELVDFPTETARVIQYVPTFAGPGAVYTSGGAGGSTQYVEISNLMRGTWNG